jgi:hypothetical protein
MWLLAFHSRLKGARVALSSLEAALLLAPPASAVCDAGAGAFHSKLQGAGVAFSRLGAALLLAPFASAMRLAGARVAYSRLGAARLLAPPASTVRDAGARVASSLLVQPSSWHRLPPPCAVQYGVPTDIACLEQPTSSHGRLPMALLQLLLGAAETPTHCVAPFTAATHPLSALNDPLVHTEHQTRRWQCESRSDVAACLDPDGQQRLGGERTVGL